MQIKPWIPKSHKKASLERMKGYGSYSRRSRRTRMVRATVEWGVDEEE